MIICACSASLKWVVIRSSSNQMHAYSNFPSMRTKKVGTVVTSLYVSTLWQDWTMFCCPRCSHLSTILNNVVEPESGVTILFNIVVSYEQCGQQNIVQSCFHQYCINPSVFTRVQMKNRLKISLLITKLSISQHIYVRHVIIRNISFNLTLSQQGL
jgi:hypothetical protein